MYEEIRIDIKTQQSEIRNIKYEVKRIKTRKKDKDVKVKTYTNKAGEEIARFICSEDVASHNESVGQSINRLISSRKISASKRARVLYLVYAFLRSKAYHTVENNTPLYSGNNKRSYNPEQIIADISAYMANNQHSVETIDELKAQIKTWIAETSTPDGAA